jgi:iron-sulfur cluster repair protein YtfE (RIC family)
MPTDGPDLATSVPDWLIEYPSLLSTIEKLGIDYTCGGKSLETACQDAGLEPFKVLEQLQAAVLSSKE